MYEYTAYLGIQWFQRLKLSMSNFDTSRRIICKLFCSFFVILPLLYLYLFKTFFIFALKLHFAPQFMLLLLEDDSNRTLSPPRVSRKSARARAHTHTQVFVRMRRNSNFDAYSASAFVPLHAFLLFVFFFFFFNATSSVLIGLFFFHSSRFISFIVIRFEGK